MCSEDIHTAGNSNYNLTLEELYSKALDSMQKAETLSRGDTRQGLYMQSRHLFEQAMDLTEKLSLFSDNETIDDVATVNLKYLLIPAYLAQIALAAECEPDRLGTFTRADRLIRQFFERIISYGLSSTNIEQSLKSNDFSTAQSAPTDLESAARSRQDKIERYKKMKELEIKLQELERRLKSGLEVDEEVSREYYLSLLNKLIHSSYESLEREVKPGLLFESNRSGQLPVKPTEISLGSTKQPPPVGTPFTIVRDEVQKQVYGLGYPSRPTLTVDQFINTKFEKGELAFQTQKEVYANSLQRYAEKPDLRRQQEEDSDAEHDEKEDQNDVEELERQRRWDEFKDDNPRGSGNRHNMG